MDSISEGQGADTKALSLQQIEAMEFKERIELHRTKLEQTLDAEKLHPLLQEDKALTADETAHVMSSPTKAAQTGRLLDVLLAKDNAALQSFYLALQKMYQHVLTSLFVEPPFTTRRTKPQTQQGKCFLFIYYHSMQRHILPNSILNFFFKLCKAF